MDRTEWRAPQQSEFSLGNVYSLQTTDSRLLWAARVCHHDDLEAEIHTASPLCSWPHIHTVALPRQLLPICCHKHGSHAHTIQSATQWHVSRDVWWWYISVKLSPHEISVYHFRLLDHEWETITHSCINDNVWGSLTQFDIGSNTGLVTRGANQYKEHKR